MLASIWSKGSAVMTVLNGFDYIIVGAGSAGCVLANRLSINQDHTVLLIENGPVDDHYFMSIPAAMPQLFGTEYMNN